MPVNKAENKAENKAVNKAEVKELSQGNRTQETEVNKRKYKKLRIPEQDPQTKHRSRMIWSNIREGVSAIAEALLYSSGVP